jgi:hypothetical protein
MENEEQLIEWFEKFEEEHSYGDPMVEPKYEAKQVCAITFLYEKLKPSEKSTNWFLHGEHDTLYIGSGFDVFEDFTEEEVKKAVSYGIGISDTDGGFQIYASM